MRQRLARRAHRLCLAASSDVRLCVEAVDVYQEDCPAAVRQRTVSCLPSRGPGAAGRERLRILPASKVFKRLLVTHQPSRSRVCCT